ncbi:hypothetical protein [Mucilaginibacter sp.]|uniref:hypothetical protein n=1 Tax=Mucilaginibacter sp. TaxID=1882438 RepID=UPI003AFF68F3
MATQNAAYLRFAGIDWHLKESLPQLKDSLSQLEKNADKGCGATEEPCACPLQRQKRFTEWSCAEWRKRILPSVVKFPLIKASFDYIIKKAWIIEFKPLVQTALLVLAALIKNVRIK